MSYKYAVLKDSPIGFYPLDISIRDYFDLSTKYATYTALNAAYATYGALTVGSSDLSELGNNPTLVGISGENSINAGNQTAATINQTSSITIANKNKAFSVDSVQNAFSGEFWFSFNNLMDGQNGYYDWAVNDYQTNNGLNDQSSTDLNIMYIKNGSTIVGIVYYDKANNTFEFKINGTGGIYAEAYCVVPELDTQYHVYFSYSNKSISITVNNLPGVSGNVNDTSLFASDYSTISYVIDGASLKANESFGISNLAFYNYTLSSAQIKQHMLWGFNDDKPITSSLATQNSFFPFNDNQDFYAYRKIFMGRGFSTGFNTYNLAITDKGLSPLNLGNAVFNQQVDTVPIVYSATDGASWTGGKSGIDFKEFGLFGSIPGTITLVVKPSASDEYILSIDKVQGNSTLYLERASNIYRLVYWDAEQGGATTVLATVSNPSTYDKIAISFNGSIINLTVNGTTSSASKTLSFDTNSVLTIGQSYHVAPANFKANSSSFASLSITDDHITSFPTSGNVSIQDYTYAGGYPWTSILKYFASFKSDLVLSQKGYWVTSIPLSSLQNVVGSKIDWTSMNNCVVEYSLDKGTTWYCMPRRGSHIPRYDFTGQLKNILIRVTLVTRTKKENYHQTFNELEVAFYRNLNIYSEGENFLIVPSSRDTVYKAKYTTRLHSYQVLSKPNNLGLLFSYDPERASVPAYAQIKNLNTQAINGVEFWLRADANRNNAKILTGDSGIAGYPDLYISSTGYLRYSNISALYVNGYLISDNKLQITDNDLYHIVVATNSYTGDLFLNGTATSTGLAGSYGFLNIWKYTPYSWDALSRYNLYIGNNTSVYANDNNLNSVVYNPLVIDLTDTYALFHQVGV